MVSVISDAYKTQVMTTLKEIKCKIYELDTSVNQLVEPFEFRADITSSDRAEIKEEIILVKQLIDLVSDSLNVYAERCSREGVK